MRLYLQFRKRQIDAETVHPQPTPGPQHEMTNSEPTYTRGTMQRETGTSKVGSQKMSRGQ
jgi:hypothetical protein